MTRQTRIASAGWWVVLLMLMWMGLNVQPIHAGERHYYYTDAQGTVLAKTDAQGNIVARYDYKPYGAPMSGPQAHGPTGYTGHVNDAETGLVYMQARYYDPVVGRFLSVDPVTPVAGNGFNFSRYIYANNNPLINIDPNGRDTVGENIDQNAMAAAGAGNHVATYAWAFAGAAWNAFGAEAVSQVTDEGQAASTGDKVRAGIEVLSALPPMKIAGRTAIIVEDAAKGIGTVAKESGGVIHVTESGVALTSKAKHQIPEGYVQNPNRSGSYGEVVNNKFKERLRIDPATPPGQKGPNYSHYHRDGKGSHHSPKPGDRDPGFEP